MASPQTNRESASRRKPRKKLTITDVAMMPMMTKSTQFTVGLGKSNESDVILSE